MWMTAQSKGEMSLEQGLKLAFDYDIIPDVCNNKQFRELWKIVNRSEACVSQFAALWCISAWARA